MQSHIVDVKDAKAMADVELAYWTLFATDLQCAEFFTTPAMASIKSGKFTPIVCEDEGEIVGIMVIKNANNGIYYPVMKGNLVAVLGSMVRCACENYDHLEAVTENQVIHELAAKLDYPVMIRDGNTLRWSR